MLEIKDVSVDLAGTNILRQINASFQNGTTVGIVGRNGAGKTTLLRSIMGLIKIKSGEIKLDETLLSAKHGYERAFLKIGYAPENRVIFPTLTVEENLRMPCEVQNYSADQIKQKQGYMPLFLH